MNLKLKPLDKKNVLLTLDGDATIYKVNELKVIFAEALEENKSLTIDVKAVHKADISFLQLLCAVHKDCAGSKDRNLTLVGRKQLAKIIGATYSEIACSLMDSGACLFKQRDTDEQ